jgi:serine/threonine protein kinase
MATAHLLERQDAVKLLERQLLSALTIARLTEVKVTTDDGRYQFQAMLGRGASGIVCKALDTRMERLVALKLYPGIADEVHAASVRNEAKRLARPSHRNIVLVHDYNAALLRPGEIRCFYVAMELLPGLSLRHWLAQPRSADAIVEVFCRAGEGLAAAHAAGLVHRDFKPENVMLVGDEPKIVDFGLAIDEPIAASALSSRDPQQRTIVGTLAYMAPETLEGHAEVRSDQFAFAAALWEALYREFPYRVDSVDPADRRHIRPPPKAAEYPAALLRCLTRALSGDPRRRYPDMNQLVSQLRDLQGELRSMKTSASMSSVVLSERTTQEQVRAVPRPSRARWLALPLVGGVAIVGVLGQAGFWTDPGPAGAHLPTEGEQAPDRLPDASPPPPTAPASRCLHRSRRPPARTNPSGRANGRSRPRPTRTAIRRESGSSENTSFRSE